MKILYVARHDCGDNQDEQAIKYALERLGHTVEAVHEKSIHRRGFQIDKAEANFCLFHKCEDWNFLHNIHRRGIPLVFWHFDLIDSDDPTLLGRSRTRVQWMHDMLPICKLGFCTDGDWVINAPRRTDMIGKCAHKLHWLMQGFDERMLGLGKPIVPGIAPIIFTGMIRHGQRRVDHVEQLKIQYGERFHVIGDGGPRHRVHGRDLANLFASTRIVVAPDGPSTPRYWSNRIYLTAGLGGFLLHPYSSELVSQYHPNTEMIYYDDRDDLVDLIDYYITDEAEQDRLVMRQAAVRATQERNLYRHRLEMLIQIVKERL